MSKPEYHHHQYPNIVPQTKVVKELTSDDRPLTSSRDGSPSGEDGLALESSDGHHLRGSDRSSGGARGGNEASGEHFARFVDDF